MNLEQPKYPIGRFEKPAEITKAKLEQYIETISGFPEKIKTEVINLTDQQLNTPYRPAGWTIRQVVHHCADSHMNSFIRLKLVLTEDKPVIRPYFEDRWAELSDSARLSIEASLKMLDGIHERWTALLKELTTEQMKKAYIHPEHNKAFRLDEYIGMYAWHCDHHLAHITSLKKSKGWK